MFAVPSIRIIAVALLTVLNLPVAAAEDPFSIDLVAKVILESETDTGGQLGTSVDIDGPFAVAGAPLAGEVDQSGSNLPGAAVIFDSITGEKLHRLELPGTRDFGFSVAVEGSRVLVGDPMTPLDGMTSPGRVYMFDAITGELQGELVPEDPMPSDFFGASLSIFGDRALVGATASGGTGAAYLFDLNTGNQLARFTADDQSVLGSAFASRLELSQDVALITAFSDDLIDQAAGSLYLFDLQTGEQTKVTAPEVIRGDQFGIDATMSEDWLLVGANNHDVDGMNAAGTAYLYDRHTGDFLRELRSEDLAAADRFGANLAILDDFGIVSATSDIPGAVYVFDLNTGEQVLKIQPDDTVFGDFFGSSIAIDEDGGLIIGARSDNTGGRELGSAYLYRYTVPEPGMAAMILAGGLILKNRRRKN